MEIDPTRSRRHLVT